MITKPQQDESDIVHAPHPPLTEYYNREEDRREWVGEQFNSTAPDYDRMEAILGFGTGPSYRRRSLVMAGLKPGMQVLDVGMGTGLVARQAATITGDPSSITGVDPSPGMIQSAKLPAGVKVVEGRAEQIPLPDGGYDFLSMGYALRHISDLSVAFAEFHRVLKPGGKVCILELTPPKGRIAYTLIKWYFRYAVPMLGRLVSREKNTSQLWRYYWDTMATCAPPERVMKTLTAAGFDNVRRHIDIGICSVYLGDKPHV